MEFLHTLRAGSNPAPYFWGEKLAKRTLVIKMKGKLKEINAYCVEIGEISNKYDIEVEFQ